MAFKRVVVAPTVGLLLCKALDIKDMSARELSQKLDTSYDVLRLIVKGEMFGSKLMMREIAKCLGIREADLMDAYLKDKFNHTLGPRDTAALKSELRSLANQAIELICAHYKRKEK